MKNKLHNKSNVIDWLDIAKGIGIILVVLGHVSRGLNSATIAINQDLFLLIDNVIYSFHMPLFFIISGALFTKSFDKYGALKLSLNKIDTILYPYILWSLLQGGVEAGLSKYTNGSTSITQVIDLYHPRAQFWFLYALFFYFVTSALFLKLAQPYFKNPQILLALVSTICYLSQPLLELDQPPLKYLSSHWVYFCLGALFTYYQPSLSIRNNRLIFITSLLAFLAVQALYNYYQINYRQQNLASLTAAIVSIYFILQCAISIGSRKVGKLLCYLGINSMGIYLMHILAGSASRILLVKGFSVSSPIGHMILGTLIGLAGPLICLHLIKFFKVKYLFSAPISKLRIKQVTSV